MKKSALLFFILLTVSPLAQEKVLEQFENLSGWKIYKAEGVDVAISTVKGISGKAVRIDYNFVNGAGYGGIQKFFNLDLPDNYQFSFYIKAQSPSNNLEFKLIDKSGENVWWVNNRNFDFPSEWKKIVIKKRKIHFAWGPANDKNLRSIDRIEFTIASYLGGKGTIYLDDLRFEELPAVNNQKITPEYYSLPLKKRIKISNYSLLNDENILIDLKGMRELGGIKIDWIKSPGEFGIFSSADSLKYEPAAIVQSNKSNKSILYLPELETKYLLIKASDAAISNIEVLPVEYSSSINRFFVNKSKEYAKGLYPRYFNEEMSYWTLVGWDKSEHEALFNEDGMIEVDKKNFSLDALIILKDKVYNWSNSVSKVSLLNDYLPFPSVNRESDSLFLNISPFAYGEKDKSKLNIVYRIENKSTTDKIGSLVLYAVPFQVNPYYQDLNLTGGFAKITSIKKINSKEYEVNNKKLYLQISPDNFFVYNLNSGSALDFINTSSTSEMYDDNGFLSGGFVYKFKLKPGQIIEYAVVVPFEEQNNLKADMGMIKEEVQKAQVFWEEKLNKVQFNLPPSAYKIINTIKSNLAYILINKDHAGIQPGSRSYERSWIRDGALTSSALLKMGLKNEVKEFINWYTKYQLPDGKVPCVVDKRGADPVPENDSHGELIYLIKQYFNYTKDTLFLNEKYSNVSAAVKYIKYLIKQRSTDYYRTGNDSLKSLYGLLPESISHEGYSDKPRHSYWDDFFAMKGLKDAVEIASILNKKEDLNWMTSLRDTFKINLYNSILQSIKNANIDYIPGCAELGDFDATSTTIALYPCGELSNLPQPYLNNTFEKYYQFFENRKNPKTKWDAYTPYENRVIGSYLLLNKPERAFELIDYFLNDNRPYNWNGWGEVVWKDYRIPRPIGDMPHTWVGSDFINSCRMLFVYENEHDSTLTIGAGLKKEWLDYEKGISVKNLPTYYGNLSYDIMKDDADYKVNVTLNGKSHPQQSVQSFPLTISVKQE